ncbi:MAG: LysR family transcriptional regulator [Clostridiales bacterium]|nr:LysR family transcriptional regulator [Candidatus Crickella merdequi]
MNDIQIDYFMAVATNLSFTKTSEELYVSQPAISRQIAVMEKELGVKLFTRNNKKTELTKAGELYFELFKNYKADFIETKKKALSFEDKNNRVFRIGFLEGWDLYDYVPAIISRFNEVYPDIKVLINCCGIKELSTLILTDGLDVAISMKNSVEGIPEIETIDLCSIGKTIVYSKRKYGEGEYTPYDFKDTVFFAPYSVVDRVVSKAISDCMKGYDFMPKLQFVPNHESMITCVRNGMGAAITDEWVWANYAEDIGVIPIDAKDMISILLMKSNHDPVTRFMVDVLDDTYKELNGNT